ncbi:SEC-C metal-binding domain-containing protein [Kribbella sp. NPDC023855]|uniref:SEC-C domain-containing protein n=1 Tax=Kribbella sp. NPDC023855 TaxID=3154698 RepID=UPI003403EA6F
METAQLLLDQGRPEGAIAIWRQMARAGGEEGDWGHFKYAEHLLRSGQEEEARAELVCLMVARRVSGLPWRLTAELLEDHDDLEAALFWYSAAVASLSATERADPDAPAWARDVMNGRRRLRWATGIPLDEDDLLAQIGNTEAEEKVRALNEFVSLPQLVDGRMQFWTRSDLDELRQVEPAVSSSAVDAYYELAEQVLRKQVGRRPVLLPRRLRAMSLVLQSAFDARTTAELPSLTSQCDVAEAVEWPPGRNQRCWCGSGMKYKKCCGGRRVEAARMRAC